MKKKKEKIPTMHELAVRLCEGSQVEFFGLWIKAKDTPEGHCSCEKCKMDSICNSDFSLLCQECDLYHGHSHYLALANEYQDSIEDT